MTNRVEPNCQKKSKGSSETSTWADKKLPLRKFQKSKQNSFPTRGLAFPVTSLKQSGSQYSLIIQSSTGLSKFRSIVLWGTPKVAKKRILHSTKSRLTTSNRFSCTTLKTPFLQRNTQNRSTKLLTPKSSISSQVVIGSKNSKKFTTALRAQKPRRYKPFCRNQRKSWRFPNRRKPQSKVSFQKSFKLILQITQPKRTFRLNQHNQSAKFLRPCKVQANLSPHHHQKLPSCPLSAPN